MGHWYDKEGKPCHTIIGKNGKERDTTVADARKINLVPGATTIIGQLNKDWLSTYKANQIIDAVLRLDKKTHSLYKFEETEKWKALILSMADEDRDEASSKGSKLHKELENYFITKNYREESYNFIKPIIDLLDAEFPDVIFESEKTFRADGYGGSIDLISVENRIIIDFKGKKDKFFDVKKYNDIEYMMQLAAYKRAISNEEYKCYNLYISYDTPGLFYLHKWTAEEIEKGFKMFDCLKNYWLLKNNMNIKKEYMYE